MSKNMIDRCRFFGLSTPKSYNGENLIIKLIIDKYILGFWLMQLKSVYGYGMPVLSHASYEHDKVHEFKLN